MPALSVSVDGKTLATVAISDATMLSVHVSGQRWDEKLATIDMSGGNFLEQLRARTPARQHVKGELYLCQGLQFRVWPSTASV